MPSFLGGAWVALPPFEKGGLKVFTVSTCSTRHWIPAFAGMTDLIVRNSNDHSFAPNTITPSISTSAPRGSDATPIAARAG